jgi:hypothetical protein
LQVSLPRIPSDRPSLQLFQLLDSHARIAPTSMQLAVPLELLDSVLDDATLNGVCFESISAFAMQYVSKLLLNRIYALLLNDRYKVRFEILSKDCYDLFKSLCTTYTPIRESL